VAAPATWNSLSDKLRNPDLHSATFRRNLDIFVSTVPGALSALEALCDYVLYKSTFTVYIIENSNNLTKHYRNKKSTETDNGKDINLTIHEVSDVAAYHIKWRNAIRNTGCHSIEIISTPPVH